MRPHDRQQGPHRTGEGAIGPQAHALEQHVEQQLDGDQPEDWMPDGPPDRPVAADDYGTTAGEQHAGEPLDTRLAREEPDAVVDSLRPRSPDKPWDGYGPLRETAGRLITGDQGIPPDIEAEQIAEDLGRDDGRFTAEEQAVRIERGG